MTTSQRFSVLVIFAVHLTAISFPFGEFERWLERHKTGWNGNFKDDTKWGRYFGKKYVNRISKFLNWPFITRYHYWAFGYGMAIVIALNWIVFHGLVYGWSLRSFWTTHGWIVFSKWGIKIIIPIYLAALYVGNSVLEDFLWFFNNTLFGKPFPDALPRFFAKNVEWHQDWTSIFGMAYYVPTTYYYGAVALLFLLLIHQSLI